MRLRRLALVLSCTLPLAGAPADAQSPAQLRAGVSSPASIAPPAPPRRLIQPPHSGPQFIDYVLLGMTAGLVVGAVHGAASGCDGCFPGTEPFLVIGGMLQGIAIGGAAGAVVWVVTRPFAR